MQLPKSSGSSAPSDVSSPSVEKQFPSSWLAWPVWGIAAIFYLTGFYQRVSPAVMTSELMRDFHIGAKQLGNLSAFYFYIYVAMQIPVGILIDSWGAKKLLIWGSILSAAGTFLFGATSDFALACFGRAIIGGATAVGWVVVLKLATHWFPGRRFAMLSGLGLCFGNLGALAAQVPLRVAIEDFGWRPVALTSAGAVLLVGVLTWLVVENDPSDRGLLSYAPSALHGQATAEIRYLLKGIKNVFAYRNTWLVVFAQGGVVGPVLAFTGLWGLPFMRARFGLSPKTAALVSSVMIICWAVASPICGALSDKIGRRKPVHLTGCFISALGWITMFYAPGLQLPVFIFVAALTSLASGAVVIGFATTKESVPIQYLGTISGLTNIGNMIGPTLLQPGIGWLLDRKWSGDLVNGVRIYNVQAFETAFLLIVAWSALACILLSLTRETYCKQTA